MPRTGIWRPSQRIPRRGRQVLGMIDRRRLTAVGARRVVDLAGGIDKVDLVERQRLVPLPASIASKPS